jgi:hypothetical protein
MQRDLCLLSYENSEGYLRQNIHDLESPAWYVYPDSHSTSLSFILEAPKVVWNLEPLNHSQEMSKVDRDNRGCDISQVIKQENSVEI